MLKRILKTILFVPVIFLTGIELFLLFIRWLFTGREITDSELSIMDKFFNF